MNSLRSPHLIHKFICTHILPSLMSWKGLQGQSHHSALDLLFLISTQEFVLSMIHLFSWFFNFSLLLITMESSSSLFKPKKNNKQNSHYTACLLQLSLSIFFSFIQASGIILIQLCHFFAVHSILHQIWFGFCSYKSTETAYPKVINDFLNAKARGQLVLSYSTSLKYCLLSFLKSSS